MNNFENENIEDENTNDIKQTINFENGIFIDINNFDRDKDSNEHEHKNKNENETDYIKTNE